MAQSTVFSRTSILDFFGQASDPANPPANYAREFYNSTTGLFKIVSSGGIPLFNSGQNAPFGPTALPNLTLAQIYSTNLSTGDHNLYTVPAGKKAFVGVSLGNNSGVGNIVAQPKVSLDNGSTYIVTNGSSSIVNQAAGALNWEYLFSAGEVVGLNTATNNVANAFGIVYLFDSSASVKCAKLTSFITGDNTLYTCPTGKTAYLVYGYGSLISGNANAPSINITTSGSAVIKINIVQNGGSVASTNQLFSATINTTVNGPVAFVCLSAGDFININTSSGANTSMAWATVVEI